jgi:hypothetical protein
MWRQGFNALKQAQETGWRFNTVLTVWASTPKRDRVAFATPVGDVLSFHFVPGSNTGYAELIGRPNLAAWIMLDRAANRILAVKFHNRTAA